MPLCYQSYDVYYHDNTKLKSDRLHYNQVPFFQNCQNPRSTVINEQDPVPLDESHPHVRLQLLECGDVEQNPGPRVGYFQTCATH